MTWIVSRCTACRPGRTPSRTVSFWLLRLSVTSSQRLGTRSSRTRSLKVCMKVRALSPAGAERLPTGTPSLHTLPLPLANCRTGRLRFAVGFRESRVRREHLRPPSSSIGLGLCRDQPFSELSRPLLYTRGLGCGWRRSHADGSHLCGRSRSASRCGHSHDYAGYVVSTDPPYYDNIGYSDLSDFFYVWLRRSLGGVHPDVLGTLLTPKDGELVANPNRTAVAMGPRSSSSKGSIRSSDESARERSQASP